MLGELCGFDRFVACLCVSPCIHYVGLCAYVVVAMFCGCVAYVSAFWHPPDAWFQVSALDKIQNQGHACAGTHDKVKAAETNNKQSWPTHQVSETDPQQHATCLIQEDAI